MVPSTAVTLYRLRPRRAQVLGQPKHMAWDPNALVRAELVARRVEHPAELREEDLVELAVRYAVWLPVSVYQASPWLAPFAVRRVRRRVDSNAPGPARDLWGFPDEHGRFTDDNSLIKGAIRGRTASTSESPYASRKFSTGFVCCHVWPTTTADPLLFSFVPNLVWLPSSLAQFSDAHFANRSPHLLHHVLRQVSATRFLRCEPAVGVARSNRAWERLNPQLGAGGVGVDLAEPNRIVDAALGRTARMIAFLEPLVAGEVPGRRFSRRYHAGLGARIDLSVPPIQSFVPQDALNDLLVDLRAATQ